MAGAPDAASHPVGVIAKMLVLTPRQVQSLTKQGVLPKSERGRYEVVPVVQAYVKYLRERTLGRGAEGDENSPGRQLALERARVAAAAADRAERRNLLERGQSYPKEATDLAILTMIEVVKTRLARVPAKFAPSDARAKKVLGDLISDALIDLSLTGLHEMDRREDGQEPDDDE